MWKIIEISIIFSQIDDIKTEIFLNGPVQGGILFQKNHI